MGTLRLPAGRTRITMRFTKAAPKAANLIEMRALELVLPSVKKAMADRAARQRPDVSWFVDAEYGLKFFWMSQTQPRSGPQKPFCEAVLDFDVKRFGDMVQDTGAGYIMLSGTRSKYWFPGPIQEIERFCRAGPVKEISSER